MLSSWLKWELKKVIRHILAVGGDGTNNEVINGILSQTSAAPAEITYALLPIGTGNDWIKTHGIPKSFEAWLSYFKAGKTKLQDIGLVQYADFHQKEQVRQRYFINVAGMAYDGFIAKALEDQEQKISNPLIYLWFVFKCLFSYKLKKARVQYNGKVYENYCYIINVGICKYSGGGMQLVPHAIPDDGLLALTIAGKLSKLAVIMNTPRFYTGSIGKHSKVETHQSQNIVVEALGEEEILLEADGEFLGTTPARYTILPNALRIIAP